ncbi:hypothetical protein C8Q80DRAFT_1128877 [Daedaleopsis nitida]|nr:hypothetical protein C8Q80DRAFT_1128877 [Daedaleopsis nitida]
MSSREPMWYCHECHAEMRPLMVPDPHCASCNGTFVEKIENPADDPREFYTADGDNWGDGALPAEMDAFFLGLRSILRGPNPPTPPTASVASASSPGTSSAPESTERHRTSSVSPRSSTEPTTGRNSQFTVRIERSTSPGGRTRTFVLGGQPGAAGGSGNDVPRLSQFAPPRTGGTQQDRPNIAGPLIAQYLLSLMGPGRGGDPFADMVGGMFGPGGLPSGAGGGGGGESGRWGDYVFNQEALDQIISQIMENSNAHQPVPATEEVMKELPRVVLEDGSPLLEKDCAVCKDQFALGTEDPDEQIIITLPCQHPFHEPCILPWLKSSGTCPVCRYQLVTQHSDTHPPGTSPPPGGSSRTSSASPSGNANGGGGLFHNMFNLFAGHGAQSGSGSGSSGSSNNPSSAQNGGNTNSGNNQPQRDPDIHFPGGWADQVD